MSKYSPACSSRLVSAVNSDEPSKEYEITKNTFAKYVYFTGIYLSTPIYRFFTVKLLSELLIHANMFEGETNRSLVSNLQNPFHIQFRFQTFLMSLILCQLNGILYLSLGKVFLHSSTSRSLCVPNRLNSMKLLRLGHYCNHQCLLPRRRLTSTATSIPKICIVGSGPASFYTAQHLIKV